MLDVIVHFMTDPKSVIELKFNRQDFEEIYFRNGQGDTFWGQNVKGHFTMLLVFATTLICSTIYSLLTNHLWGFPIVLFFICLLSVLRYEKQISPILKWKKQVNEYLTTLSKFKSHKIILTTNSISIIQDNEETITKMVCIHKGSNE